MQKAVFFSGQGTVYTMAGANKENPELYAETLPALRFLHRRGFILVLVTKEHQEYKSFVNLLKDRSLPVQYFSTAEDELHRFAYHNRLTLEQSVFVTDGMNLELFLKACPVILVLTGRGFCTLEDCETYGRPVFRDVCRDIYAAAFSIAFP